MSFGQPWVLILFGLIPLFFLISRGRLIDLSPWRRHLAIGLRLILFSLLVLALAETQVVSKTKRLSVTFLVDQSDSIDPETSHLLRDFINEALTHQRPDDRAGLVVFGANALVEERPSTALDRPSRPSQTSLVAPARPFASRPDTSYTNIAAAIQLGLAIFPSDTAKRLVLLSDGKPNLGQAKAAARMAATNGVEIFTFQPPQPQDVPEVRLNKLRLPNTLGEQERFDLDVDIESNLLTETELQVYVDGQLITQSQVNLKPGSNRFLMPLTAGSQGFSTFQVRLLPRQDTQPQNNRLDAFSFIEGVQKVLIVARERAEVANFVPALELYGLQPVLIVPSQLQTSMVDLSQYASLVLVNVSATALSPSQLALIQVYVRDLGGGLIVVGGAESYGAGGYFQTPLEETLPVEMALKDKERLPGMSMFLVIDKSGSMTEAGAATMVAASKVELAKEAINRTLDLLMPLDRVGIVAFDSNASWVVRPRAVDDLNAIRRQVGTLRAAGGTDILAGLKAATDEMLTEASRIKHIVLLTDGGADPQGLPELVQTLVEHEVSISVVAIGDGYAPFLEQLAIQGNGRFQVTNNAATIPQIFAQEAALALRAYIVEESFSPQLHTPSPVLRGLSAVPRLHGYIATTAKVTAQTVLLSHQEDPILAHWQYGLGRALAWTSDAKGQWAKDWVGWEDFARFWSQVIAWTVVEQTQGVLEVQTRFDSETGTTRLSVEALDAQGSYLNNLTLTGRLVSPDLEQSDLMLDQVGPGLYETVIHPQAQGAYLLYVQGTDAAGLPLGAARRGFVVNYSPEYAAPTASPKLMAELAALGAGEGRILRAQDAAQIFERTLSPVSSTRPLWPTLLTIFVCLLPVDIGLRRVIFGREEVQRMLKRWGLYLPQRQRADEPSPQLSRVSSLLSIKEKPVKNEGEQVRVKKAVTVKPAQSAASERAERPVTIVKPQKPSPPAGAESKQGNDSEQRLKRLLQAKHSARKK